MLTKKLLVVGPGKVENSDFELSDELRENEALVRTQYSIVSAGTEGATFTGLMAQMPFREDRNSYPIRTGYGNVGEVLAVGSNVSMCKPGDRVLSFSPHASHVHVDATGMALPIPAEIPGKLAVFARMAGVGIAALRSSSVQPGDKVLIIGLGLVGNLAGQLFQMAGADTICVDISSFRVDRARQCGLQGSMRSGGRDLASFVDDWTGGRGAHAVVDATGLSEVVAETILLARMHGEFILLGTPRAKSVFDATPMLLRIHLRALRVIGALEWSWPIHETLRTRSVVENYRQILKWISTRRLIVEPLITQIARPDDCQSVYKGVTAKKDEYLGVVFDWTQ